MIVRKTQKWSYKKIHSSTKNSTLFVIIVTPQGSAFAELTIFNYDHEHNQEDCSSDVKAEWRRAALNDRSGSVFPDSAWIAENEDQLANFDFTRHCSGQDGHDPQPGAVGHIVAIWFPHGYINLWHVGCLTKCVPAILYIWV